MYFKDSIRIPEISVLLMLVDDSAKNPRRKREALLNPKYKFIGISSSDVNNNDKNEVKKNNDLNDEKKKINEGANNNIERIIRSELNKSFCAYFALK